MNTDIGTPSPSQWPADQASMAQLGNAAQAKSVNTLHLAVLSGCSV